MYAVLLEYHTPMMQGEECTPSCQSGASPRVIAIRMMNRPPKTRERPHPNQRLCSHRRRLRLSMDLIFYDYDAALKLCKTNNTVIAGTDGNLSMGTNDGNVCGTFGIPHTNYTGRRMHSFLSIRGLTIANTFFQIALSSQTMTVWGNSGTEIARIPA